jgi:hypothetical protein
MDRGVCAASFASSPLPRFHTILFSRFACRTGAGFSAAEITFVQGNPSIALYLTEETCDPGMFAQGQVELEANAPPPCTTTAPTTTSALLESGNVLRSQPSPVSPHSRRWSVKVLGHGVQHTVGDWLSRMWRHLCSEDHPGFLQRRRTPEVGLT